MSKTKQTAEQDIRDTLMLVIKKPDFKEHYTVKGGGKM